jgi:tetratricopeptide (TPR) repeat protein
MRGSITVSAVVAGLAVAAAAALMPIAAWTNDDVPLYQNMGDYSRPITTDSAMAQAYFDQGLRLAYGFARSEAARSFQAAQAHDPNCAMCAWGNAWVLGPYQNNPDGVGEQEDAYAAAQQALDLASSAQPWEQALIEAMAVRYTAPGQEPDPERGTQLYSDAMRAAATAHHDDLDIRTLYAESLMMFRPWNLYREDGEPYPETRGAIVELETVLDRNLHHGGACHLYIHAVEAYEPARAEACADRLAEAVPGVSHIQHMPSHIYMNIGRYGDAVRANQRARRMDQAADSGEAVSVYPSHNTMMLMYAARMAGQSGVALSAARDLGKERPEDTFQQYLQLARFGRWDELLQHTAPPEEPFQAAMWQFARGLAKLRTGDDTGAQNAMKAIRTVRDDTPEDATYHFFLHSQRRLLGVAQHILAGEIAAANGDLQAAEEHLRRAIALEDGLGYSEPEPWPIPARHVLGAVLLEAGQPREATKVHLAALEVHPDNGWSLRGLEQSLAAQGKDAEAAEVREAFAQAWERADVWLPGSRF